MENRIYTLILCTLLSGFFAGKAKAQDTTTCNPGFQVSIYQQQAYFLAVDTLPHILHYWNFGDSSTNGFHSYYAAILHVYRHPGSYRVTHIIKDSLGGTCYDSSSRTITVDSILPPPPPPPPPHDSCGRPVSFTYQADASNPLRIHFSPHPDSDSAGYRWNFGDSTPVSSVKSPTHTYAVAGSYYVSLTEVFHSNPDSCSFSYTRPINVDVIPDTCHVGFTITRAPRNANELTFTLQGRVQYDSVLWTVNQIPDSMHVWHFEGRQFTHVFTDSGCYGVFVAAIGKTCPGSAYQQVCLDSIPSVPNNYITSFPNPVTTGQTYLYVNLATAGTIRIDIFTSMGKPVQTSILSGYKGVNQVVIPTADLPKGIYYVRIRYGNEVRNSKIQKL
jgi:PKD repeat protein